MADELSTQVATPGNDVSADLVSLNNDTNDGIEELSFASQHLRNMLVANKDAESINIKVSNDGIMEVKCVGSDFMSTYFLLPLDK